MVTDEKKDVILRWFDTLNQGDLPLLDRLADELFTADFVEHDPRMPDFELGPQGVKNFIHQVLKENTGVQVTVHDIFESGDKTAYRATVAMTDAVSKKTVQVMLLAITRFEDGRCAEEWQLSAPGKW